MSRHIHRLSDHTYVAYGFDNLLGYFANHFNDEFDEPIVIVTGRSNVVNLLERLGVLSEIPDTHVHALAMDLPIPS